jgi:diguanylate cyclase (GGDEF)-like protein
MILRLAEPIAATVPDDSGLAYVDALTGLPNRRRMERRLTGLEADARRDGTVCALVAIDLNGFKRINDSLGHGVGDEVLVEIARRFTRVLRRNELLARLGGDEFVVLVADLPAGGAAQEMAEGIGHRLVDELRAPIRLASGVEILADGCAGVSLMPGDAGDGVELARHADAAMYAAKAAGRPVMLHGPDTPDRLAGLELAAQLRRGIERDELELHFQPIVRLADERILGVEPLVRWRRPGHGLVMPDGFIGVAERTGVIEALGDWVLEAVCRQSAAWAAERLAPNAGVNVSPAQLRRPGFAARTAATLLAHGVPADRFVLELTESAWSLEAGRLLPVLAEARARGLKLAIDDFGAGYSSLWRLRELPVQIIKVDRAFLNGVPEDPQAAAIVSAILRLAEACGCDVVAEGVETREQRDFLLAGGCRIGQGFLFARPLPAAQVTELLHERIADERRLP